jgi:hypothetical protein
MAAGLGFKTFTTGEVLTAADTNGYLMQGVLVFASSAARAAAITSPQEGQYSYLKDTNSTEYYDGAAWIAAPIGDITGVTAGIGITGGGTSGTVTVTNDMATTITAAGDIVVGTGSGTYDNLPIGTTAQVLTADTTVSPYKVKWATPAAATSGLTLITKATLLNTANTGTTFDGVFTSTYLFYLIKMKMSPTSGTSDVHLQVRNSGVTDTAGYYGYNLAYYSSATGTLAQSAGSSQHKIALASSNVLADITVNFSRNSDNGIPAWDGTWMSGASNQGGIHGCICDTTSGGPDGFIVSLSANNMNGEIAVYGLAKA